MNRLAKILMGVAIGVTGAIIIKKATEKKYVEPADVAEQAVKNDHADDGILKRIKRYVEKKVIKLLAWAALHMEQIESASALIGFGSTAIGIITAVKEFRRGEDTKEQLDRIEDYLLAHEQAECARVNNLGKYTESCAQTINNNLKQIDKDVIKVGEKLGVQMLEEDEVFESCAS